MRLIRKPSHLIPLLPLLVGLPALADSDTGRWQLCPAPPGLSDAEHQHLEQLPANTLSAWAEHLSSERGGILRLDGDVTVEQQGVQIHAEHAHYQQQEDRLQLSGPIRLRSQGLLLEAEQAEYHPATQQGRFQQASFFLPESHSYGRAETILLRDGERMEMGQLSYTTCPPEQEDWRLSAQRLKLNQATNTGEAYHATLRFKGVPFFYSPYLNFPLAGRKSGLLPPSFGSSKENGTDISLPFYWNIAPNRDATITPRHIGKRGNMLAGELRFLEHRHSGELQAAWLANDQQTGEDRSELQLRHSARLSPRWRSELRYHGVSDDAFYRDDLGSAGHSRNESNLERRLDLRYRDPHWLFLARAQDYQSLGGTAPYQRLPQLRLHGASPQRNRQLHYRLDSEAVSFRHPDRLPTGERIDLKPQISLPMQGAAWFLTPALAWRHTEYSLQGESREVRSMPLTSVDSGLFFERPAELAGRGFTQTLEPRLFLLHVPYREQQQLPRFDTHRNDLSFAGLFRDNRFSGADRQGDAKQVTLALSSRLLEDSTGKERARIGVAQARYLESPRVGLDTDLEETRRYSDIIGELALSPLDSLNLQLTEQWNPDQGHSEQRQFGMRYAPRHGQQLQLNYRYYRPDEQRQADLTALWPLSPRWRILAHHNRDLEQQKSLLNLAGLEYESCCWTARLVASARRDTASEPLNHALMLTLELKGLASLGQTLEQSVGPDVLGYD